jgi:sterol desaturase/sphingolipid hydroxylase (fatty acid hydroxylase superfamily)
LIAFFIASFVFYWWHRATHYFDFLWRFFHQLHHSAKRLESLTSFFAHPFDVTATILLNAFCCYFILGASPFASFLELLLAGFFSLWTHMDLKTPYWLGYIIQRPEMHSIHHQKNHHSDNYAGFPLWDMLFGIVNLEKYGIINF